MKNKLIWMLLSLLGFASACSDKEKDEDQNGNLCMYGCPSVTFSVKGTVTNEAGQPIPGIRVGIKDTYPTLLTDDKGGFAFTKETAVFLPEPAVMQFTDVDGAENGLYDPKEVEISFTRNPDVAAGEWYRGDFTAEDIAVTMTASDLSEN